MVSNRDGAFKQSSIGTIHQNLYKKLYSYSRKLHMEVLERLSDNFIQYAILTIIYINSAFFSDIKRSFNCELCKVAEFFLDKIATLCHLHAKLILSIRIHFLRSEEMKLVEFFWSEYQKFIF